jgi:hypothetical protein
MDESATSAERGSTGTRPRFPWLVALLCAASLGVAAWTWMRYSYAWKVTPSEMPNHEEHFKKTPVPFLPRWRDGLVSRYVRTEGTVRESRVDPFDFMGQDRWVFNPKGMVWVWDGQETAYVRHEGKPSKFSVGEHVTFVGRVERVDHYVVGMDAPFRRQYIVDTTASRFTWQSITGLVVGAMGVFGFAVYLRTWVKGRRAA